MHAELRDCNADLAVGPVREPDHQTNVTLEISSMIGWW